MNAQNNKIKTFQDLFAWQYSFELSLMIYRVTKTFPKHELWGLTSQIQRSGVSVSSNIAEGFSRYTNKDKIHFYRMSLGSLTECQNQIIISHELCYINSQDYNELIDLSVRAHKVINKLIKSTNLM